MINNNLTLFLHIGQPKTGSSAIQAFLNYNRKTLVKNHQILYPNFSGPDFGKGYQHNHKDFFLNAQLKNDYQGCLIAFKNCLNYCEQNNITKLIISNESFGWHWWPKLLNQIIETLECDFKIVLYLRRQDHWVESAWKQWGHKNDEYNSIQDFSKEFNMDWMLPLTHWLQVFQPSDFIVRPFENKVIGDDVVMDFARIIGIESKSDFINPPPNNLNKNAGFSREIIELLRLCNKQSNDIHDNRLLDFVSAVLPDSYKKQDPFQSYGLLSPAERLEIANKYEPSNNEIGKIFFGVQHEKLFIEPLPDPNEAWEPFEGLTVEKIVPVFIDMLMGMHKQIRQIDTIKSTKRNDVAEPFIQENSYAFTNIPLRNILNMIEFNDQITDVYFSESGLSLTSLGSDPYFILPLSLNTENIKAIKIDITVPEATSLQLFFKNRISQTYCESNSIRNPLHAERTTLILIMSKQTIVGNLRIDPGCHSGKYIIHKIEIAY